jgi:hypothetical protein
MILPRDIEGCVILIPRDEQRIYNTSLGIRSRENEREICP